MPTVRRLLVLLGLVSCTLPPDPGVPVPIPAVLEPSPAPSISPPAAPLPAPVSPAVRTDPERDRQVAADSAADAAMLDLLAQVEAPDNATLAPVEFDLDVSRWAEHDRVQYYLKFFQGPARDRMAIWLARLPRYEAQVRSVLQERGLPGDLAYLALIESGYSNTAVSRSRAVGMWQFMQPTGRMYGLRVDSWVDERRDFVKATDAAARYLADLTRQFGSHFLAAAAYNGGPGRVSRGLDRIDILVADDAVEENSSQVGDAAFFQLSDTRHIHQETKDYVPKLLAATMIAKEPAKYGFTVENPEPPFPLDSLVVTTATGLDVVAKLADVSLAEIRALNPQYLRLTTPPGRSAVIRLPAGTMPTVLAGYAALPPSERVVMAEHVVRKGETLGAIARRYGVATAVLADANPSIGSRALLRIGQVLVVPGAAGSTATVASATPSRATAAPAQVHTVRAGETLGGLSNRFGVTLAQLRSWNDLGQSSTIKVGQRLQVSAGTSGQVATLGSRGGGTRIHVVARGQTLSAVAARYNVSVRAIQDANGLASPNQIKVGQRLRIP